MLEVFYSNVLYSKIINTEVEPYRATDMLPKARRVGLLAVQSSRVMQAVFSRVYSLGSRLGGVRTFLSVFPCRQIHFWLFVRGRSGPQYRVGKDQEAFSCTHTDLVGFQGTCS